MAGTEIVEGELVMSPVPSGHHQDICGSLCVKIRPFVDRRRLGKFYCHPLHIVLAPGVEYEPDLCLISRDRLPKADFARFNGPPDLIIEVISESNRKHDTETKFGHYERYGVLEYWLVDLEARQIQVWFLEDGRYISLGKFGAGQSALTRLMAGLHLDPARIF